MKTLIFLIVVAMTSPCFAAEKTNALFVVQEIGAWVDPGQVWQQEYPTAGTAEEKAEWQVNYDNYMGLKAKAVKAEGWLIDQTWADVLNEKKGRRVIVFTGGRWRNGRAFWFLMERFTIENASDWFDNKISVLIGNGWLIRGWATDDVYQELSNRNYVFLVPGE